LANGVPGQDYLAGLRELAVAVNKGQVEREDILKIGFRPGWGSEEEAEIFFGKLGFDQFDIPQYVEEAETGARIDGKRISYIVIEKVMNPLDAASSPVSSSGNRVHIIAEDEEFPELGQGKIIYVNLRPTYFYNSEDNIIYEFFEEDNRTKVKVVDDPPIEKFIKDQLDALFSDGTFQFHFDTHASDLRNMIYVNFKGELLKIDLNNVHDIRIMAKGVEGGGDQLEGQEAEYIVEALYFAYVLINRRQKFSQSNDKDQLVGNWLRALSRDLSSDGSIEKNISSSPVGMSFDENMGRSSPVTRDSGNEPRAASDDIGGIDLNPSHLNLQIKRDGSGVPLPINLQPIGMMQIDGFVPVIINIIPVISLPLLSAVIYGNASTQKADQQDKYQPSPMVYLDERYLNLN
jgi:hypothetical protein